MKIAAILYFFISSQVFSCNDIDKYEAIIEDIKASESFISFIEEKTNSCSNIRVWKYLSSICYNGSTFMFDYPDINDYLKNCNEQNSFEATKYSDLKKLSDKGDYCLTLYFSVEYNNKVIAEMTLKNNSINTESLRYLYEVSADGVIHKLEEYVITNN